MLNEQVAALDEAVKHVAEENDRARLLMTQPGVGPITSMAFVLTMGDVSRFPRGKQVASYLGLIPREYSSGGHQQFGRASAVRVHQQARQPLQAHAAGGSGAVRGAVRRRISQRVFTPLPHEAARSGESGSGEEIGRATLLDAANEYGLSRDRSRREQLAGAPGRRKLGRRIDWALSSR